MAYDELVLNAPETLSIVVTDTVITNSGDEPMIPGEYIDIPRANTAIATAGFKSVSCSMGAICSVGPAGGANGPITFDGVAGV